MKMFKKISMIVVVIAVTLTAFYIFWLSPRYTVPILMYHRFGYEEGTLFVTPENFSRQMEYLKKHAYSVISLDELARRIKTGAKIGHNTVVITIDDGYGDNYVYGYPVLRRYKFPATIFIASNLVGHNKEFLDWGQVKEMLSANISFGGHTRNHAYLPSISSDNELLWDEVAGAKKEIEKNTGLPVYYFCYPIGGFDEKVKEVVREAGYLAACTTNRGFVDFNKDLYELKRVKITNSDGNKPFSLWAKLTGYYNLFRSKKRGY